MASNKYTKINYAYSKTRKNCGRQTLFQDVPAYISESICPDKIEQKQYILRNPVHREVQATSSQSGKTTNTPVIGINDIGINHTEGGWPREVHPSNEEQVHRHKRRILHDDSYVHTVLNLTPVMQHYVDQNNAIDMYQSYFSDMQPQAAVEKYNMRIANVFRDPIERSVSCIQWTNEKNTKIVVSYSPRTLPHESVLNQIHDCYFWDITRQMEPVSKIKPAHSCWQLACSPVEPEVLIAGLVNGIVNIFDVREGTKRVSSSSVYNSHFGPITSLLYTHSRTNTEFFTGSLDGRCLWWDTRNLSEPTSELLMDSHVPNNQEPCMTNAEGVSTFEFDRGLPTRFLCGTESGSLINVNRMGRSHSEILYSSYDAHLGPVRAVHRSHCTPRMFGTCGDWSVKIWSEEIRIAPIIVTLPYRYEVLDFAWTTLRYSCYFAVTANGFIYYWDLLRKQREATATLQVSKHSLLKVTPQGQGELVAVGDSEGTISLLHLSENMVVPGPNDKQLFSKIYELQTKREHILDNRLKEIRLKIRAEEEAAVVDENLIEEETPDKDDDDLLQAETEYFKVVKKEAVDMDGISIRSILSLEK